VQNNPNREAHTSRDRDCSKEEFASRNKKRGTGISQIFRINDAANLRNNNRFKSKGQQSHASQKAGMRSEANAHGKTGDDSICFNFAPDSKKTEKSEVHPEMTIERTADQEKVLDSMRGGFELESKETENSDGHREFQGVLGRGSCGKVNFSM
jgi:hypothetical protein